MPQLPQLPVPTRLALPNFYSGDSYTLWQPPHLFSTTVTCFGNLHLRFRRQLHAMVTFHLSFRRQLQVLATFVLGDSSTLQ